MCDICYGIYANCPVCGEEPETEICSSCEGVGKVFFDEYGNSLSNEEAKNFILKGKYVGEEHCPECGGMIEIEIKSPCWNRGNNNQ